MASPARLSRPCLKHAANSLDEAGVTLASAATVEKDFRAQKLSANIKSAEVIGDAIAQRALAKDIKTVVFDRGGFPYHGCVKALAEAARKAGLEF